MSFEALNLHHKIMTNIKKTGYTTPTPIQEEAIPLCLSGKDVVGLAQTGTGKTAAFVLPILQRLITRPRKTIRALIIAPTRELTEQTHQAVKQLGCRDRIVLATKVQGRMSDDDPHAGGEIAKFGDQPLQHIG